MQVDADLFKPALPEWDELVERDALSAGYKTRAETGMLCEIAQEEAMRQCKHIWVDGSLRDGDWYRQVFEEIPISHPNYAIAIFHVLASRDVTFQRAAARAALTGRHVPPEEIDDSLARVPKSVEQLTSLSRFVAAIDNSDAEPRLVRWRDTLKGLEANAPAGGSCSWSEIRSRLRFKGFSFAGRMSAMSSRSSGRSPEQGSMRGSMHAPVRGSFRGSMRGSMRASVSNERWKAVELTGAAEPTGAASPALHRDADFNDASSSTRSERL